MTIAEHLADPDRLAGNTDGRPCVFAATVAGLDDTDRAAVLDALDRVDPRGRRVVSDDTLAAALAAGGRRVSPTTIGRHRRHRCNCPTTSKDTDQ